MREVSANLLATPALSACGPPATGRSVVGSISDDNPSACGPSTAGRLLVVSLLVFLLLLVVLPAGGLSSADSLPAAGGLSAGGLSAGSLSCCWCYCC